MDLPTTVKHKPRYLQPSVNSRAQSSRLRYCVLLLYFEDFLAPGLSGRQNTSQYTYNTALKGCYASTGND